MAVPALRLLHAHHKVSPVFCHCYSFCTSHITISDGSAFYDERFIRPLFSSLPYFSQRPRWAQLDTGITVLAGFAAQRLVAAVNYLAFETTIRRAEERLATFSFAGDNAPPALYALGHIADHPGVLILDRIVVLPGSEAGKANLKVGGNTSQLADIGFITYQAGIGVAGQHQLDQNFACGDHFRRVGLYYYTFGNRGMAGADQRLGAFHLNDTKTAGTDGLQVRDIAEGRNIDAVFLGRLQDGYAGTATYRFAINSQVYVVTHVYITEMNLYGDII